MNNHPIHVALSREAAIAAEHLGAGAAIIGKSNYAHHGQDFFTISKTNRTPTIATKKK